MVDNFQPESARALDDVAGCLRSFDMTRNQLDEAAKALMPDHRQNFHPTLVWGDALTLVHCYAQQLRLGAIACFGFGHSFACRVGDRVMQSPEELTRFIVTAAHGKTCQPDHSPRRHEHSGN